MIPPLRAGAASRQAETVVVTLQKILVVDEALPVRRALLDALHKLGVPAPDVSCIDTAEDALECFVRLKPTLVFTEFVGGEPEEGLAMVREMLALDPHAKLVLVTAEPIGGPLVRAAVRAGAFAVIEKPLRHEKIRQVLQEMENESGGVERFR